VKFYEVGGGLDHFILLFLHNISLELRQQQV
jgi:hypothetical protein